jgi:hypothetical protein
MADISLFLRKTAETLAEKRKCDSCGMQVA